MFTERGFAIGNRSPWGETSMKTRRAFTYIEVMMVVIVAVIVTMFAMPDADAEARQQGRLAGEAFISDVMYAQSLSIARPDDPVVIKVDADNNTYWLAKAATPDVPITKPLTDEPYVRVFGDAGDAEYDRVEIVAQDFSGDAILAFDSCGALDQQTPAILQLSSGNAKYEVQVSPITAKATVKTNFSVNLAAMTPAATGGAAASGGAAGGTAAAK